MKKKRYQISRNMTIDTPLNAGELKVLEGTHGTGPMGLLGGEVGLEKRKKRKYDHRGL